jgi:hypothetical protein
MYQKYNRWNEDSKSAFFEWFCQERMAAIPIDGPGVKAKAKYFTAHSNIKNPKCSERRVYHSKVKIYISMNKMPGQCCVQNLAVMLLSQVSPTLCSECA